MLPRLTFLGTHLAHGLGPLHGRRPRRGRAGQGLGLFHGHVEHGVVAVGREHAARVRLLGQVSRVRSHDTELVGDLHDFLYQ